MKPKKKECMLMYMHVSRVKENMKILVMTAEEMCTPYFPLPNKQTQQIHNL